ncbi:sodium:solute symporter family protein [Natrialbaceae archaeon AArc-T1-2]|uniref:sodium:solute symporter family protein n=1 Tax=Natrialbaceae archaeon AArc-T1-2 TaxID=3053904 RepID=UPI00255A72D5|nr:sodium:solute symporter family protein [Natrialbaceae archaeon AArc-T1-2]WIV65909.1 sodium:solute symporter family protein [Natrialbaceae archaeon AArc-T1-2]
MAYTTMAVIDTMTDPLIVTMALYFIATIAVALWFGRHAGEDYISFTLAGRDLGLFVYMMTYFATFVGGGLIMGVAQEAFIDGISAQWYAMTQGLAWITITILIGFLYSFKVVSVPELLGRVFGRYTQFFAAIFTVIGQVALTAGQTIGMASIIAVATDIPLDVAFWVSVAVFIAITAYGGMASVAWADAFHGVLIIVGMVIAIPMAVSNAGGLGTISGGVPDPHLSWFGVGLIQIGSWYLMYITVAGANQQMLQRTWSAKSRRVAILGTFLAGSVIVGFGILTATAGMIANAHGANIDSSMAFAWTLTEMLPPVFAGLLLAASVAAVMSGADSFLLAGATTFVNDLYIPLRGGRKRLSDKHLVLMTRLTIIGFGVFAALIAQTGIEIVAINTLGMGVMSILFAGILAMLWEKTTRQSALPAFVVGGTVVFIWGVVLGEPELLGQGSLETAVPATAATLIVIAVLSYAGYGERFDVDEVREAAAAQMQEIRDERTEQITATDDDD